MEVLNLLLTMSQFLQNSSKNLQNFSKNSSEISKKSNSSFLSMSAATLLGPNLVMLESGNQIPKWIRILNGIRIFFEIRIIDQKIRIPPDGSQMAKKIQGPNSITSQKFSPKISRKFSRTPHVKVL